VLACSTIRKAKERAMRRRRFKQYWNRLKELRRQKLKRDQLLMKIGAAKKQADNASKLVELSLPAPHQTVSPETFSFSLCKDKLRKVRRQEGQYLLRSNLAGEEASTLWKYYIQLVEVEQAFKTLKNDLSLRPIYHQKDPRIEAHIFVAFLSYCLQVTLQQRLKALAPGLTVRSILEKFTSIQLVDIHLPTTDGKELRLPRYTEPDKEHLLLLSRLDLKLPPQPRPELLDKKPAMTALKMNV
jgi:transposase